MYDYIIVGQGIAGTMLAHFLDEKNKRFLIVDKKHEHAASLIAAGVINPITGRNFVKSWRIDEFIPFANNIYRILENKFDISILESRNIAMIFNSVNTENNWMVRSSNPELKKYISNDFQVDFYTKFMKNVKNGVEFKNGGRVKIKEIVLSYKKELKDKQKYLEEAFDYSELNIQQNNIAYKGIYSKRIIFAEGFQAIHNPFFNYLPFMPAKGDMLLVRINNHPGEKKIIKHGVFIINLEDDIYWIGSTYNREYKTLKPNSDNKLDLIKRLKRVIKSPFTVIKHLTAIRPTVRDRRPFIGKHPIFSNLYIFNGMGAKGATLAPYFAHQFIQHLEHNKIIDKEVDIKRYISYFNV
ncbi:MAG: FAD-dependent oxidoreductase [Saprospiraceae bacterium]|nr:FAD-dependent oxidoreductase [Saprospiraceae bacterium]